MKTMGFFEELKREIIYQICYEIDDCDKCPDFISKYCKAEEEAEEAETKAPKGAPKKDWRKLKEELCHEIGDCDMCPPAVSKHCKEAFKAMEDWEKPQEPKDSPSGWVKLKTTQSAIYINTSKIVAIASMMRPDGAAAPAKAITKIHTVGAEDNPWMVDESIDEVVKKIERA